MRIAVIGAGGVGGYFGGRLAAAGEEVFFLARGAHLRALQTSGLSLQSPKGDLHLRSVKATDDPQKVGTVDVVLLTVKMYDVDAAAAALTPLLGPDTAVITVQNGVEAVEMVAHHIPRSHVVGGVAYIVAAITEPGTIRHTALDLLIFGELEGRRSPRLERFADAGRRAGFQARVSDDILIDLWGKFTRLSVFSGLTAAARSPLGVIRQDPDLTAMMRAALQESLQVARASGVALSDQYMKEILAMVGDMPAEAKSSMLEDLEHGRRLELPWLNAAIVRLGREAGVPTPTHQFIAAILKPFQDGTRS
jgi:2-dehydropantoate 2-reductase